MKKAIFFLALFVLTLPAGAAENKPAKVRNNRVDFGPYVTGMALSLAAAPGYKDSAKVTWEAYSKESDRKSVWALAPEDVSIAENIVSRMPVLVVNAPAIGCDMAPRLMFLVDPAAGAGEGSGKLFAYEYNVCDTSGMLNTEMMMDQYIAKYGMYDRKDYDRKMIVYHNVMKKYRVGVRPLEGVAGKVGLTITVLGDEVFRSAYQNWRAAIRTATRKAQREF
ncbi:MAG: hypothetical protein HZB29_05100 [Nitrospinae bacterium]|nr:hypothetical protein [Nitrospinota bacterium]